MTVILVLFFIFIFSSLLFLFYFTFKNVNINERINNWFSHIQPLLALLFLFTFLVGVIYSSIHYSPFFLPEPASTHGKQTVPLFNVTLMITGFVFFITHLLLFYFIYRYQYKSTRKAYHFRNNNKIELIWTIIPAITFIVFFVWGQILWEKMTSSPKGKLLEIEVMGQQFNWWVRYPGKDNTFGEFDYRLFNTQNNNMGLNFSDPSSGDDILPIQLHLPKNKPVRLRLRSRDVIHSVFIPHLRVKMDAVPGMPTYIHFTPDISTEEMRDRLNNPSFNYEISCAELCGRMHFAMKLIVVVEEQAEFDKWYQSQKSWLSLHPELINQ